MRPPGPDEGTDWPGMLLTLLIPAVLITGLIYLLVEPRWEDPESGEWLDGLVAVIPLEFVRIIMLSILRDTYREYASPRQAVRFFLISMAALVAICLAMAFAAMGWRLFGALADAQTWRFILPPLLIVVLDAVINLVFFRGDHGRVAAQLDAAADDAESWFGLACYPTPIVVIVTIGLLFALHASQVVSIPAFDRATLDLLRSVFLGYAIVYFIGKAIIIAHVYTGHFLRTGRRLLGGRWMNFLRGKSAQTAAEEAQAADRRLRELRGEPVEPAVGARQRRRRRGSES
ncbi:MAG: hypothetical protein ABI846_16040 [Rudaea sp.]